MINFLTIPYAMGFDSMRQEVNNLESLTGVHELELAINHACFITVFSVFLIRQRQHIDGLGDLHAS